jgi:murein L,D-transpeptidase YcbB/YkuD
MMYQRTLRARPVGRARAPFLAAFVAALTLAAPAQAQAPYAADPAAFARAMQDGDGASKPVRAFYRSRSHQPLWIRDGAVGPEAETLLRLIETAELDGLDPDRYRPRALAAAIERAGDGSPKSLARAEMLLSRSFVDYVRDLRRPRDVGMVFADAALRPTEPSPRAALDEAAAAPSFAKHVADMAWMSPAYAQLRRAAMEQPGLLQDPTAIDVVRVNLDRARALPPASTRGRYVLVDAAAARLWMYENGRVAGTMRVVVGKPTEPTPMMAGLIRYASVNPYWNIPPDLVRIRVAPGAIEKGPGFLKAKRFEVLSDWSPGARVVDPSVIDWSAVRSGVVDARVRQLPGANNAMGRIKFMFPNDLGIYLHDTPEKALLKEDERLFSSGCVRLENAPALARWLFGKPISTKAAKPEQRVDLAKPVPVYITYLTAAAEGSDLVFRPDPYNRDGGRAPEALASR